MTCRMSFQLSPYSPLTLTLLLVTVGSTEARETAAIVVCQKVLEMREEHTVHVASIKKKDLKEEGWVLNDKYYGFCLSIAYIGCHLYIESR